jgi:hypothetical protein
MGPMSDGDRQPCELANGIDLPANDKVEKAKEAVEAGSKQWASRNAGQQDAASV